VALVRPGDPVRLTDKQARFVEEYLVDLNATQAALRAGYSARTANLIGKENLRKPAVALAIQAAQAERAKRTELDATYVVENLRETVERCMQRRPGPNGQMGDFDPRGAVAALRQLGLHLGMFRERVEVTTRQPAVLVVPGQISAEQWAVAAEAQQAALAERVRTVAAQHGVA
jgi:phage terminase small subunit